MRPRLDGAPRGSKQRRGIKHSACGLQTVGEWILKPKMKFNEHISGAGFAAYTALCAALMSVSAMISVPFFVPFTLQTLAFYFILFTLGGKVGLASSVLYILIGAVGLPVFSGFCGGVGRFFEPGGGFIIGFAFSAAVYLICERLIRGRGVRVIATVLSFLTLYFTGAVLLVMLYTDRTFASVISCLAYYIAPFIVPDSVKIFVALFISNKIKRHIKI